MAASRTEKILQTLREIFALPKWTVPRRNPFETLIVTIISQNTVSRNTAKAFGKLSKEFRITPEALANAEISQIEKCLNVAGLYRNKSKIIKQISKIVHEKFHDDLKPILSLSFEEARRTLLELPGIGPETADVVLLFCAEKPTVPVDTHVNHVAKRLGLVPTNGNYEMVHESLQLLHRAKDYLVLHVLLIQLGRRYCKARNPLCKQCAVDMLCPSKQLRDNND